MMLNLTWRHGDFLQLTCAMETSDMRIRINDTTRTISYILHLTIMVLRCDSNHGRWNGMGHLAFIKINMRHEDA